MCGHSHKQDLHWNRLSQESLVCNAPQLFTKKKDDLGYAIILLKDNCVEKIIYRQYSSGKFFKGSKFSENESGEINVRSNYIKNIEQLELCLNTELEFFKGQPTIFIKPKISHDREFNDEENLLDEIITSPQSAIIVAQPQFGLTCLSHYMRLEAYKLGSFWIYIDAKYTKARHISNEIEKQLHQFNVSKKNIGCIILDSWDSADVAHRSVLKCVDDDYNGVPIIVMSNYTEYNYESDYDFSQLNTKFTVLHLQALQRTNIRDLVVKYNQERRIADEDQVVTKVVRDLEALNIHRTPINCLTLLKVFERDFNNEVLNRTRMIKAVLFILFTDADSFTYSSTKPEVEDCEHILGRFCKQLLEEEKRSFTKQEIVRELEGYCNEKLIKVDVATIVEILESNKILIRIYDRLEFRHSYWIFYFAATHMLKDKAFSEYILCEKRYVNFPEIIEFYTGTDGLRDDAISTLLQDNDELINTVREKIGISEDFSPFEKVIWGATEESIEAIRKEISEKVEGSNLPVKIKDQHADESYNSDAPYDQSISKFLNEYAVVSLIQNIRASSGALRNSNYIDPELKIRMMQSIINGWEQLSRILFWISPILAHRGEVTYDGLSVFLGKGFTGTFKKKLKDIFLSNPMNTVSILKDGLSSKKIGPLLFKNLDENPSEIQRHFIALFLCKERPEGWYNALFKFMNLLHRNSFYLGDLCDCIKDEIEKGFISSEEMFDLKKLINIVDAKINDSPKKSKIKEKGIPKGMTINEANRIPIDRIRAIGRNK